MNRTNDAGGGTMSGYVRGRSSCARGRNSSSSSCYLISRLIVLSNTQLSISLFYYFVYMNVLINQIYDEFGATIVIIRLRLIYKKCTIIFTQHTTRRHNNTNTNNQHYVHFKNTLQSPTRKRVTSTYIIEH